MLSLWLATLGSAATPDLSFWVVRDTGTTAHLRSVAFGGEHLVAVGDHGTILVSMPSGWKLAVSGLTNDLRAVTWANGLFVAVGSAGTVMSSPDGLTWAKQTSGIDGNLQCITFGNNTFLALGSTNSLLSKDGAIWSRYTIPNMSAEAVCYGNGRFVTVGVWQIGESVDGRSWRLWPQVNYLYHGILFAGGNFTAVGEGEVKLGIWDPFLWSAPGVVDQGGPQRFPDINVGTLRGVALGDGTFVVVGGTRILPGPFSVGKLFSSTAGASAWTTLDQPITPWPETYYQLDRILLDVAYGNGKFVAVGENGILVESGAAVRFDPRLIRVQPDGQLQFGVLSPVGSQVEVESSADSRTWSNLLTISNSTGRSTGQLPTTGKRGFLRAKLLTP